MEAPVAVVSSMSRTGVSWTTKSPRAVRMSASQAANHPERSTTVGEEVARPRNRVSNTSSLTPPTPWPRRGAVRHRSRVAAACGTASTERSWAVVAGLQGVSQAVARLPRTQRGPAVVLPHPGPDTLQACSAAASRRSSSPGRHTSIASGIRAFSDQGGTQCPEESTTVCLGGSAEVDAKLHLARPLRAGSAIFGRMLSGSFARYDPLGRQD